MDSYNQQRLILLAEKTFGDNWVNPLARAMRKDPKQIMRWKQGLYEPSDRDVYEVEEICRRRMEAIAKALRMGRE